MKKHERRIPKAKLVATVTVKFLDVGVWVQTDVPAGQDAKYLRRARAAITGRIRFGRELLKIKKMDLDSLAAMVKGERW